MNVLAHARKPFLRELHHVLHMLVARAEHDVFAASLCNVLGEHLVQPLGLLQGTAQGVQIFLVCILQPCAPDILHPLLQQGQVLLVLKNRGDILRRGQNTAHNRLA